ncbi:MAG: hypothetical protein GY865_15005 [candidate division Zixibacteria bacterium]|nr:hypothetical protein [candidate division Zixibacteria bacterium]
MRNHIFVDMIAYITENKINFDNQPFVTISFISRYQPKSSSGLQDE